MVFTLHDVLPVNCKQIFFKLWNFVFTFSPYWTLISLIFILFFWFQLNLNLRKILTTPPSLRTIENLRVVASFLRASGAAVSILGPTCAADDENLARLVSYEKQVSLINFHLICFRNVRSNEKKITSGKQLFSELKLCKTPLIRKVMIWGHNQN